MLMEKMNDLIATSKIEKKLLKYLNPIFLDTKYEIIRIKVYENNSLLIDGVNGVEVFNGNAHAEIHLPTITQGNLEVTITSSKSMSYFAAVSGKPIAGANMRLAFDQVLDPTVLSEGGTFKFGKPVRIVTFIDQPNGPITNVKVNASIKHPNGSTDMLPLFDDGAHHDGRWSASL